MSLPRIFLEAQELDGGVSGQELFLKLIGKFLAELLGEGHAVS